MYTLASNIYTEFNSVFCTQGANEAEESPESLEETGVDGDAKETTDLMGISRICQVIASHGDKAKSPTIGGDIEIMSYCYY